MLWVNGKPRALPDLGGVTSAALDIGDEGTIVGSAHHPGGTWNAVVWTR